MSDASEKALNEVIEQIGIGARPLNLSKEVAAEMKERYRYDFEKPENEADWPKDKPRILVLSRIVGNLATFLTIADATRKDKPTPTEVASECAYIAGFIVSRSICPKYRMLGKHCKNYPAPPYAFAALIAGILREVVEHIVPVEREGPLSS